MELEIDYFIDSFIDEQIKDSEIAPGTCKFISYKKWNN